PGRAPLEDGRLPQPVPRRVQRRAGAGHVLRVALSDERMPAPASPYRRHACQANLTGMAKPWKRLEPWLPGGHPSDDGDDALRALADITEVRRALEQAELSAVRTARRHGKSWTEIATML